MDPKGMEAILSASPTQIRLLERKLDPGSAYAFLLKAGPSFAPSEFPAYIRPMSDHFQLRMGQPVQYTGDNQQLQEFASHGWHNESSLDELIGFIRQHFNQSEIRQEQRGLLQETTPPVITDLQEAKRHLINSKNGGRILITVEELKNKMQNRIHGQVACVNIIAEKVALEFAKIERKRPLSFFFFGPSGVGKTEASLVLAESLDFLELGIKYKLIRFNMNEYQERHSAYRFVGAPPSYVGYGDTPLLFQEIQRNPYLVILLDEIEKAHPDIFKTLMALVDTGELSHAASGGNCTKAEFGRCIVIFTSNINYTEASHLRERFPDMGSAEFQVQARESLVRERIPPEIVGRIGCYLMFSKLQPEDLLLIITNKIQRCGAVFGLTVVSVSPELLADMASKTASSSFGVRIVEQMTEQMMAPKFLHLLHQIPQLKNVEVSFVDGQIEALPAQEQYVH